jgi:choline kinase
LGTCGGFQHALIEFARNVLEVPDADHAETAPAAANLVVTALSCSLVGRQGDIVFTPGSRLDGIFGGEVTREAYHCNYGPNPAYRGRFESAGLTFTGFDREAQVRAVLAATAPRGLRISYTANARFHGGASLSLRAAREATAGEPFLLLMSDHLLSEELLARLLAAHAGAPGLSFVAADSSAHDLAYTHEATKLLISGGIPDRVLAIGKQLPHWTALDTGAFLLAGDAWQAVDAAPEDCELSVVFTELIARGALYAADVSGSFWYDIDTADDLAAAGLLLAPHAGIA